MFIFDTLILLLNGIDIPKGEIKAVELKKRVSKLFDRIKISIERSKDLKDSDYTVAGFYIEELKRIELLLILPKKAKGLMTIDDPNQLRFYLAQTIQHEYIHHRQFLKRSEIPTDSFSMCPKARGEKKYLAERDEIDAYSYDVAIEVYRYGWKESQTLQIYRRQFEMHHPVMKRLLKKTYKNLGVLYAKYGRINESYNGRSTQDIEQG